MSDAIQARENLRNKKIDAFFTSPKGSETMYRITFKDGSEIEASKSSLAQLRTEGCISNWNFDFLRELKSLSEVSSQA